MSKFNQIIISLAKEHGCTFNDSANSISLPRGLSVSYVDTSLYIKIKNIIAG